METRIRNLTTVIEFQQQKIESLMMINQALLLTIAIMALAILIGILLYAKDNNNQKVR